MILTNYNCAIIGHSCNVYRLVIDELIELLAFLIEMKDNFFPARPNNPKYNKRIIERRRDSDDLVKFVSKLGLLLFLENHLIE